MSFSNYFYGSYKINSIKQYPQEKINFKIVSAKIDMENFKDEVDVASKLIKYSEPNKKSKLFLFGLKVFLLMRIFIKMRKLKNYLEIIFLKII